METAIGMSDSSAFGDPIANPGLVHIHIGKTSGTSLARSLASALGEGVCSPPFIQTFMNSDDANYYNSFRIIHGHISRSDQLKWFPERKVITILRDPIERGLSFIRYVRSLPSSSSKIAADAREDLGDELTKNPGKNRRAPGKVQ